MMPTKKAWDIYNKVCLKQPPQKAEIKVHKMTQDIMLTLLFISILSAVCVGVGVHFVCWIFKKFKKKIND
jgi:hypothetical protein